MGSESQTLEAKREELIKIKEELKKAKEKATQSWLNSRPLIDELERLKLGLAKAETKNYEAETLISNLEAALEAIESSIKSKKDGELSATKATEELNRVLDQLRREAETLKHHIDEAQQKRSRVKQGLRVNRQKLRALQHMLVAAKSESEACGQAANEALKYSNFSKTESVKLSHEEYEALKKRADDENALAEWRISVVMEQKAAMEKSQDLAMAKWKEMKKKRAKRGIRKENKVVVEEEELGHENKLDIVETIDFNPKVPMAEDQPIKENYHNQGPELVRRVRPKKMNNNKKKKKKKKKKRKSFFMQMRQCFMINIIKRLFG